MTRTLVYHLWVYLSYERIHKLEKYVTIGAVDRRHLPHYVYDHNTTLIHTVSFKCARLQYQVPSLPAKVHMECTYKYEYVTIHNEEDTGFNFYTRARYDMNTTHTAICKQYNGHSTSRRIAVVVFHIINVWEFSLNGNLPLMTKAYSELM